MAHAHIANTWTPEEIYTYRMECDSCQNIFQIVKPAQLSTCEHAAAIAFMWVRPTEIMAKIILPHQSYADQQP